jgi:hypothetical protein
MCGIGGPLVQIDVPIAWGIGSLFADAARVQLASGRAEYHYRALVKNNIYQIFFFSWIPVYFVLNYFGWETTHMWWHEDSAAAYPYFVPILMVVFFGAANAGFLLGARLVRQGRVGLNRGIYLGILVYAAIWVFGQFNRTPLLGTYSDYVAGRAPWFYTDSTFTFMLIFTLAVWAAAMLVFVLNLRAEGKHLDLVSK